MNDLPTRIEEKPRDCDTASPLRWTPDLVRRFWNYHSNFPEKYFTSQFGQEMVAAIRTALPKNGGRVLDYACGTGALTGVLLESGLNVGACDFSPESVSAVSRKFSGYRNFAGVVLSQDIGSIATSYELAVLSEIVEHVDDDVLHSIFEDVSKVLVPGGLVVVTTPNEENLCSETVYCPCCNHTFHRWQHVRSWSPSSLALAVKKCGFSVVNVYATDFSLSPRNGWFRYLVRKYVLHAFGQRRFPHLVCVARKGS
jgi:2-polyprenyl-3-methyl-5-hydroxy-6-metoxy-1,4-benzoquinol methylase